MEHEDGGPFPSNPLPSRPSLRWGEGCRVHPWANPRSVFLAHCFSPTPCGGSCGLGKGFGGPGRKCGAGPHLASIYPWSSSRTDFAGGRPAVTVPREGLNGLGASGVWQTGGSPCPYISTRAAGKGGGNVLQFCDLEAPHSGENHRHGKEGFPGAPDQALGSSDAPESSHRSFVLEMEKLRPWPGSTGAAE